MIISGAHNNPNKQISTQSLILIFHLMLINLVIENWPVSSLAVDHCYSDIGCFPLSDEFYHPRHRPFNVRPWHRSRIKTRFDLFNHKHVEGYELRPWNKINLLHSGFNPLLETKIIIPGWLDNIKRATWVLRMKDSFMWLWQPVNIIVVHWRNFTPYTIATANTRVVGAELANLLKFIEHELNYDRAYYHLVGHSLGAHISGYCGDRLPGLGRITALDPARPFFQHMPKSVRLDRGDARFVDAIHSDFTPENAIFLLMSFGMTTPVGHLDFYPNGPPLLQPGCLRDTIFSVRNGIKRGLEHKSLSVAFLESIRYLTACDHQRSHEWFIESITNRQCVFVGVRCNQFEGLINGRCTCDDSRSACAIMGIHADQMYLNEAHEDLWPLGSRSPRNRRRPSIAPVGILGQQQADKTRNTQIGSYNQLMGRPIANKGQMYSRLKHQAEQLRRPPLPSVLDTPENSNNNNYEDSIEDLSSLQDSVFVDYLRSSLLLQTELPPLQPPHPPRPLVAPELSSIEDKEDFESRQSDDDDDDDLGFGHLFNGHNNGAQQLNDHPKLLSDIDRDIESWYEESSRWYLKTNNRPSYCVNQYQVMVFIGPLKSSGGHQRIRANLIISIIGSKGQLLNQRFIPRSANLDSFTMQPFFIILEGSYSLGNIVSVAVGWEARIDPDPIQATISFQSNLLESAQSMLPTYKAKHPWLSETLKYDHSAGFRWNKNNVYRSPSAKVKRSIHSRVARRNAPEGCSIGNKAHCRAPSSLTRQNTRIGNLDELLGGKGNNLHLDIDNSNTNNYYLDDLRDDEDEEEEDRDDEEEEEENNNNNNSNNYNYNDNHIKKVTEPKLSAWPLDLQTSGSEHEIGYLPFDGHDELTKQSSHEIPIEIPTNKHLLDHQQVLKDIFLESQSQITAELHNLKIHQDPRHEDSIVVSQVLVSPLQATYGKGGRAGKIFCPPHQNYRLERERTVRLVPNLLGKCNINHHHQQHHLSQPPPSTLRVH